jgi:DNA mismatch repair protein MSH6
LNAVEDIEAVRLENQRICTILKELPDLEKKINKLYHYAVRTTSASKAVYFEDLSKNRLKEFKDTMEKVERAWEAISLLRNCISKFKSIRLRQLLTIGSEPTQSDNDIYN